MRLIKSFGYAFNGISNFFAKEKNGQIQLAVASAAIAAGLFFQITSVEWCILVICCGLVISLEMMNSAIEKICNQVHPQYHPQIKIIKDISAASVLISAIAACVAGLIIFLKYL